MKTKQFKTFTKKILGQDDGKYIQFRLIHQKGAFGAFSEPFVANVIVFSKRHEVDYYGEDKKLTSVKLRIHVVCGCLNKLIRFKLSKTQEKSITLHKVRSKKVESNKYSFDFTLDGTWDDNYQLIVEFKKGNKSNERKSMV